MLKRKRKKMKRKMKIKRIKIMAIIAKKNNKYVKKDIIKICYDCEYDNSNN